MSSLRMALSALALTALATCQTTQMPQRPKPREAVSTARILAIAFDASGRNLYYAVQDGARCVVRTARMGSGPRISDALALNRELELCPERIHPLVDGSVLLTSGRQSIWIARDGNEIEVEDTVIAAADRQNYVADRGGSLVWTRGDAVLRLPSAVRAPVVLRRSTSILARQTAGSMESLVRIDASGAVNELAGPFAEIDSFDVSPDEKEIVISARRDASLDAGLLSIDGGKIHWIAPDDADETDVSWAPRGNKVTYFVRTAGGVVVRTVHIPTSFQLAIDLPLAEADALAWEPNAERFAMIVESPEASSEIAIMKYGGEERSTLVPPARRMGIEVAPWGGEGIVLPPKTLRYNERYPAVVWLETARLFEWSDARADLREAPVGMIVTSKRLHELDASFWDAVGRLAWVDPEEIILVAPSPVDGAFTRKGTTIIAAGKTAAERTRPDGSMWITIPAESRRTVESFAANWIAERVKGQSQPNGRR